jgi:hypothetical protein
MVDIGRPTAAKVQANASVWKRQYASGVVYVNPSQTQQIVDGYTLAPEDALIVAK